MHCDVEVEGCGTWTMWSRNDVNVEEKRMYSCSRCYRDRQVCVTEGTEKCFHLLFKILTLPPSRPFISP